MNTSLLPEYRRELHRRAQMPRSIDKRLSLLLRTEAATDKDLHTVTTEDLRGFLDARKLTARTRYSYISHWASFFKWALLEGHVTVDPTLRLARPKIRVGLPRPVSNADIAYLIENAPNDELAAMILLASYAGLRCMEIAGLDASDVLEHVDPPALVVAHGKGDKPRVLPIGPEIVAALRAHGIPKYGPVFVRRDGERREPWDVSHMIRRHLYDCNIEASAHQLRHTYATAVYRQSGDLRMTQELLGHSSPATTAIYTAWSQDRAYAIVSNLYPKPSPPPDL
jgi:integrase/recombinase XerC